MSQPSRALLEAFDRFWAAYPTRRPNPKAAALALFLQRVREGVDAEALIGAAASYAQECSAMRTANDFIVHAKTFLGPQRRYLDYLPSEEAAPSAAGPEPHALDFLREVTAISEADFVSWISPLKVEVGAVITITAPLKFARDEVQRRWGRAITERLGAITWSVKGKDAG